MLVATMFSSALLMTTAHANNPAPAIKVDAPNRYIVKKGDTFRVLRLASRCCRCSPFISLLAPIDSSYLYIRRKKNSKTRICREVSAERGHEAGAK